MNLKALLTAGALGATVLAGNAEATILFEIDAANSWVSVTSTPVSGKGLNAFLAGGVNERSFSLDEGQSATFNFLRLSGKGVEGTGTYYISAQLAFARPLETPAAVGHGGGVYAHYQGVVDAGTLTWTDMPTLITLKDGSVISVDFEDGWRLRDERAIVRATVRLVEEATAVAEPGTVAMIGAGLAGMGFAGRRRNAS
jgi:hypothetical protein